MRIENFYERANTQFPGSNHIIDMRNPDVKSDITATHITLTKDGGAYIWAYPQTSENPNRLPWSSSQASGEPNLMDTLEAACDTTVQDDDAGIRFTRHGVQISRSRSTGGWGGDRNKFSLDIRAVVERLLDCKIVTPRTPIFVGNWARRDEDGELIGSVAQILKGPTTPNTLVLYHGTSNARAIEIMQNGLVPMFKELRAQSEKREVDHRADCVYLTASRGQAEYYAKKAMQIDRKRLSWSHRSALEGKINGLHYDYSKAKAAGSEAKMAQIVSKIEQLKRAKEVLSKMSDTIAKAEPVILSITLTRADYKNLMADDDYIRKMEREGKPVDPRDWRESLSDFGQIAYRGTVPPTKIKET